MVYSIRSLGHFLFNHLVGLLGIFLEEWICNSQIQIYESCDNGGYINFTQKGYEVPTVETEIGYVKGSVCDVSEDLGLKCLKTKRIERFVTNLNF